MRSLVAACNTVKEVEPVALAVVDEKPAEVMKSANFEVGMIEGEVSVQDLTFPRLSIAQAISESAQKNGFSTGSLVLKNDIKLVGPGEPLIVTVVKLKLYYEDNPVKYNSAIPLKRFNTLAEVNAAGLSLFDKTARNVADAYLMIECPRAELIPHFPIDMNGKNYTLAIWTLRKSAYSRAAKSIISEQAFTKKSLLSPIWKLTTKIEKLGEILAGTPSMSVVDRNTPDTITAITLILQRG